MGLLGTKSARTKGGRSVYRRRGFQLKVPSAGAPPILVCPHWGDLESSLVRGDHWREVCFLNPQMLKLVWPHRPHQSHLPSKHPGGSCVPSIHAPQEPTVRTARVSSSWAIGVTEHEF